MNPPSKGPCNEPGNTWASKYLLYGHLRYSGYLLGVLILRGSYLETLGTSTLREYRTSTLQPKFPKLTCGSSTPAPANKPNAKTQRAPGGGGGQFFGSSLEGTMCWRTGHVGASKGSGAFRKLESLRLQRGLRPKDASGA